MVHSYQGVIFVLLLLIFVTNLKGKFLMIFKQSVVNVLFPK